MNKKLIYKILAVTILLLGISILAYGIVDFFVTAVRNDSLTFDEQKKQQMHYFMISAPIIFIGFYLFVLGWGKTPHERRQIDSSNSKNKR